MPGTRFQARPIPVQVTDSAPVVNVEPIPVMEQPIMETPPPTEHVAPTNIRALPQVPRRSWWKQNQWVLWVAAGLFGTAIMALFLADGLAASAPSAPTSPLRRRHYEDEWDEDEDEDEDDEADVEELRKHFEVRQKHPIKRAHRPVNRSRRKPGAPVAPPVAPPGSGTGGSQG